MKPITVLTEDQVMDIFRFSLVQSPTKKKPTATSVARQFCVSEKTIRDIWCGRTWHEETLTLDPFRAPRAARKVGRPLGRKDSQPRRSKAVEGKLPTTVHGVVAPDETTEERDSSSFRSSSTADLAHSNATEYHVRPDSSSLPETSPQWPHFPFQEDSSRTRSDIDRLSLWPNPAGTCDHEGPNTQPPSRPSPQQARGAAHHPSTPKPPHRRQSAPPAFPGPFWPPPAPLLTPRPLLLLSPIMAQPPPPPPPAPPPPPKSTPAATPAVPSRWGQATLSPLPASFTAALVALHPMSVLLAALAAAPPAAPRAPWNPYAAAAAAAAAATTTTTTTTATTLWNHAAAVAAANAAAAAASAPQVVIWMTAPPQQVEAHGPGPAPSRVEAPCGAGRPQRPIPRRPGPPPPGFTARLGSLP